MPVMISDENFWARAAAEKTAERSGEGANGGESLTSKSFGTSKLILFAFADGDDQSIPLNTQFFHDDYDDGDGPGFDHEDDGDDLDLMTALAGTPRRVSG